MATIEVYADIWCPFAHVGIRAAVRRRREFGREDVILRVRPWPLELVNGAPLGRADTERHVVELKSQIAPDLFSGIDWDRFPTSTLPALALAEAAYRYRPDAGEAVNLALRDALFEQHRDISDPRVLADVVRTHGIHPADAADGDAVVREWHAGEARGVKGSPHFFCADADVFCPSLDITKDEAGDLQLRRNAAALDAFLAHCFGS